MNNFSQKLTELLKNRQDDTGEWVDIPEEVLQQFKDFVEDLSKEMFPVDYVNSRQVVVEIADRKRRRFPTFNYFLSGDSEDIDLQNLESSEFNLSCAFSEWDKHKKIARFNKNLKKTTQERKQ